MEENCYGKIWGKVFQNKPSKTCGRQPLKDLQYHADDVPSNFLKAVFHKFNLVHY